LFEFIPKNFVKIRQIIAFTLAEVLITLLIIGVVASLVVPALINETQKAEYVTKLKKESAVLQQAFKLLALDAGGSILNNPNFNCSGSSYFCGTSASKNAMNAFVTKLNVVKNCGSSTGCWYTSSLRTLKGTIVYDNVETSLGSSYGKAILADGTMMWVQIFDENCTTNPTGGTADSPIYGSLCGDIFIDINGEKGPNQIGRDYHEFRITKTGIYPVGIYDSFSCDINSTSYTTSYGCTAKVLQEGAMNY